VQRGAAASSSAELLAADMPHCCCCCPVFIPDTTRESSARLRAGQLVIWDVCVC
jgi:hypothetical protein